MEAPQPEVVVGVGDFRLAGAPSRFLATYGLGSCVAVVFYDWRKQSGAMLHVMMPDSAVAPEKALTQQLGGFPFVEVLDPRPVFHPAISSLDRFPQLLCLGDPLAGTRVSEILLQAYGALAMQNLRLRGFEALGALNVPAAHWCQDHLSELPLTRRAFLEAD